MHPDFHARKYALSTSVIVASDGKLTVFEIAQSILNNTTTLDQNIRVYLLRIEKMSVNVYETIQGINYYDDRRLYRDCPSLNFKSGDIIIKKGWHDAATSLTCMSCNKKINPNGKDSAIVSQSACSKMIKYDEYNTQCHVKVNDGGKVGYNKKYFTFTGSDSVKRCFQCSSSEYTGFGLLIGPVDMNYCQSIYHGP